MTTGPIITEGEWFNELKQLSIEKGLGANIVRERWITHYEKGKTPEQAMRYVLGDDAFERLCRHGVYCQGKCTTPGHSH